ncbi:MAG: HNH endonuclease [Bdellovibrionaceae bacterium]|nr:HNH endonuclease [Pseudobdellovibrionaceae bacterium]
MYLKYLKDHELLDRTQSLVKKERYLLTQVLHHLREVERRKLFSELGYQSLFEYAVKKLKYSEGQAGRRIQAMRLIKELPELEVKIKTGALSLTNISQAQAYFREVRRSESKKSELAKLESNNSDSDKSVLANSETSNCEPTPTDLNKYKSPKDLSSSDKLNLLESLENKSTREGQKILRQKLPQMALPKERERILSATHSEMKFIMTDELKSQLNQVRSLIGAKGVTLSLAELIEYMAQTTTEALKIKKFGKKRIQNQSVDERMTKGRVEGSIEHNNRPKAKDKSVFNSRTFELGQIQNLRSSSGSAEIALELPCNKSPNPDKIHQAPDEVTLKVTNHKRKITTKKRANTKDDRYISQKIKCAVWHRDRGKCQMCNSQSFLNIDHIQPVALGGAPTIENLRLLCFNCNQRQAINCFGIKRLEYFI